MGSNPKNIKIIETMIDISINGINIITHDTTDSPLWHSKFNIDVNNNVIISFIIAKLYNPCPESRMTCVNEYIK